MTSLTLVKLLPSLLSWGKAKVVHQKTAGLKLRWKKLHAIALIIVAIAVGVGTILSVALPEPEAIRAASSDGRLVVAGRGVPGGEITITERNDFEGPFTAAVGSLYEVAFREVAAGEPLELSFSYDGVSLGGVAPSDLVLLSYDRLLGAWKIHPAVPDAETRRLYTTLSNADAGLWAVGRIPKQEIPSVVDTLLSELIASPPPGAVGYRAYTSISTADSDFVLIGRELARGGCGGEFASRAARTRTSRERRLGDATYRVTVLWELENGGCPAFALLRSGS